MMGCFKAAGIVVLLLCGLIIYSSWSANIAGRHASQISASNTAAPSVEPPARTGPPGWTSVTTSTGATEYRLARTDEGGMPALTVLCDNDRQHIFSILVDGAASLATETTTFTIDGRSYRVAFSPTQATQIANFPDSDAGLAREDRVGRALLLARSITWSTSTETARWTLPPPDQSAIAATCGS